jgi:O-antigen ligase/tetratricopeptide (TPR) repeat protein
MNAMTRRRGAAPAAQNQDGGSSTSESRRTPEAGSAPNRVRSVADGIVEATCLVAVVMLPLYFFLLSPLGPETDKAVILIALACIATGAWLVGEIDRFVCHAPHSRANLLLWSGVAVFAVYAVATALSIHPATSLFGTIARHQGLLTHAGYTVFFLCVATRLRRGEQVRRLLGVVIFASLPAVVYGIFQQFGVDPAPTVGDISTIQWPVRSSFGQHIFFAAYLVLVIPLTGARLLDLWDRRPEASARGAGDEPLLAGVLVCFVGFSFLGFLALGQHLVALFAIMPALLAGYVILGVALEELANTPSMLRLRIWLYATLLALQILALIFTSARGPWLGFFATLPVFALLVAWRLNRPRIAWGVLGAAGALALFVLVLNIPSGPLASLRTKHIFNRIANVQGYVNESSGAGRLQIWQGVGDLMTKQPAIRNTWGGIGRAVVGYGPESMDVAFEAVFPLKLRVQTSELYTWDRAHSIFLDILVDAGLLGLLAFLLTVVLFIWRVLRSLAGRNNAAWLTIGLATAVAGHLVEGIFGLETAASLLIFWVILGVAAGPSLNDDAPETSDTTSIPWQGVATGYWVVLLLLGAVVMLLTALPDHPEITMSLWLVTILGGVGTVTWLLVPRKPALPTPRPRDKRTARGAVPLVTRTPRATITAGGAIAVLVLLGLFSQWNYETAALAETAGFHNLTHGHVDQGIADLQSAASMEDGQAKYQEDLATVFGGIASGNPQSSDPVYAPHGDDPRTLDPQRILTLGRNQLYALAALSLQSARAVAPLDPTVYSALGDLYMNWGKPGSAIYQYRQAERLSHDNPRYIDAQALARLKQNRVPAAAAFVHTALRLDPTFWYSWYAQAKIDHVMGKRSEARSAAHLALYLTQNYRPLPSAAQLAELHLYDRSG